MRLQEVIELLLDVADMPGQFAGRYELKKRARGAVLDLNKGNLSLPWKDPNGGDYRVEQIITDLSSIGTPIVTYPHGVQNEGDDCVLDLPIIKDSEPAAPAEPG